MNNLKDKILFLLDKEFVRFLIVGGLNTIIGYTVTLILYMGLKMDYRAAQLVNFMICFPIAYTLQALYAFRTKWSFKRFLIYPFSSLPNYILQFTTLLICVEIFGVIEYIAYLISYIVPIPIMFFVIRFLVKPWSKKE
ncbi:MAG: GtrA family protein [Eubacteriales bacterium]